MPPLSPIFLAGPTAAGKSAVAMTVADRVGGEIISVDSMQVYRGLDIGTAKPSPADRHRIPHHLIDVVDIATRFDAAQFVRRAGEAVEAIHGRGHCPIFCGGTGLYFKACMEGLGTAPSGDPELRTTLETTPLPVLLEELARVDPATFSRIDRQNPRRVIRAIEVVRLSGRPFSEQRTGWRAVADEADAGLDTDFATPLFLGLRRTPDDLYRRIHARVDEMFRAGLVEETRRLLNQGLEQNPTAMQALGYRQVVEHLRGERSLLETIDLVKIRTRQFAKRQMTWFRRQAQIEWIEVGEGDCPDAIGTNVLACLRAR
jgi:tRNA dimethylallyltransferase